jgi:hypothetical protein
MALRLARQSSQPSEKRPVHQLKNEWLWDWCSASWRRDTASRHLGRSHFQHRAGITDTDSKLTFASEARRMACICRIGHIHHCISSLPRHIYPELTQRIFKGMNRINILKYIDIFYIKLLANDIWKLGCTTASGASASTIIAATARVRNVTARRSTITAISTTAVMKNERWVATSQPDSNR